MHQCDDSCIDECRRDARFFNYLLLSGAGAALLLTKGGTVSVKTRKLLSVALAGALVAVVSDALIRPNVKV